MAKEMAHTLIHHLLSDNTEWNFWKNDYSKLVRIKWNGKTPFQEVRKAARKFMGIKDKEMMYERSLSNKPFDLVID